MKSKMVASIIKSLSMNQINKKTKSNYKIFIIAGEASGDLLGSKVIAGFKNKLKDNKKNLNFVGIGGLLMKEEGLKSIFPMEDLSVMGIAEVIPHIPKLLKRIKQTVDAIIEEKPDLVVTIDSPDFSFRVIKKLLKEVARNDTLSNEIKSLKKIHLIAPSVWAYRANRAKKIAKLYDLLLAILPFEPPYFEKYGLKTIFIGNPIVEKSPDFKKKNVCDKEFRQKYNIKVTDKIIYVTPGSRISEVKRIFPQFIKAINLLAKDYDNIKIVIPTVKKTVNLVKKMSQNINCDYFLIDNNEKESALFSSNFALAKSGTNNIEISLYKIPLIIAYRFNFFTYLLAKIMIKVKFANLINIILNKQLIPELIQYNCKENRIYQELKNLINNENICQKQVKEAQLALNI